MEALLTVLRVGRGADSTGPPAGEVWKLSVLQGDSKDASVIRAEAWPQISNVGLVGEGTGNQVRRQGGVQG